jgi:hypothetical protein
VLGGAMLRSVLGGVMLRSVLGTVRRMGLG